MSRMMSRGRSVRSDGSAPRAGAARPGGRADERRHLGRQPGGVALEHEQPDLVEHRLDRLGVERLALGEQDLLGGRRLRALVAG